MRSSNSAIVIAIATSVSFLSFVPLIDARTFAQEPTDAQIASIVVTANQVDIDAGKLAQSKAESSDVKSFAALMVTDHTGVNKSATDLVKRLKVTPADNATSQALKAGGEQNVANLRKLAGASFDKAYIDHEVAYHQQVLDAVDKTLIPNAKNAELKALLVKVRPAFVAHLEHAKQLQASLAKRVAMEGVQFQPQTVTVRAGDSVVWVNNDPFPHTVTSAAGGFDSHAVAAGQSWTLTPRTRGEFPYACSLHPTMKATLRVL